MTQTTSNPRPRSRKPNRRHIAAAALVIFIWLGASGVFGPLFGKLTSVQENNNSAFLPDSAESTEAAKIIAKFSSTADAQLPALVLLEGSVAPATLTQINVFVQKLPSTHIQFLKKYNGTFDTGVPMSKYLSPGVPLVAFPSSDGKAILVNLPVSFSGARATLPDGKPILTAMIKTIRTEMNAWAKSHGFVSHVTWIAALYSDCFGAFGGIDSSLLLTPLGFVSFFLFTSVCAVFSFRVHCVSLWFGLLSLCVLSLTLLSLFCSRLCVCVWCVCVCVCVCVSVCV